LLAEPRDPASLADAIRALVTGKHDWVQVAEAACRRHQRCFSDLSMASGTADVYRRLLKDKRQDKNSDESLENPPAS
jgi:hypothetical protein